MNELIMHGYLSSNPERVESANLVKFSIAHNHRYKHNGEEKEEVCFIEVTAFGKRGDLVMMYLGKGDFVAVKGRLRQEVWETKEGIKRSKHSILMEKIKFLRTKKSDVSDATIDDGDDVPF